MKEDPDEPVSAVPQWVPRLPSTTANNRDNHRKYINKHLLWLQRKSCYNRQIYYLRFQNPRIGQNSKGSGGRALTISSRKQTLCLLVGQPRTRTLGPAWMIPVFPRPLSRSLQTKSTSLCISKMRTSIPNAPQRIL